MRLCAIEDLLDIRRTPGDLFDLARMDSFVQVWIMRWNIANEQDLAKFLTEKEVQEVASIHCRTTRAQKIISRFILKNLCSKHLSVPFSEIVFERSSWGKPVLAPSLSNSGLQFNISHAGFYLGMAFSVNRRVGIDIEIPQSELDFTSIMQSCLSPREILEVESLSEVKKKAYFLRCWTLKEAFAKTLGLGLGMTFNDLEFHREPHQPIQVKSLDSSLPITSSYSFLSFDSGFDLFRGSVAAEGANVQFELISPELNIHKNLYFES